MRRIGSILRIMKMFCTRLPKRIPQRFTPVRSRMAVMAIAFCVSSPSGTKLEIAAAKATASAAIEPEEERQKFAKPHMKATRSP